MTATTNTETTVHITTIQTDALNTVVGGGSTACDEPPPPYRTPKQGAGQIAATVYDLTDKLPKTTTANDAAAALKNGKNWNDTCNWILYRVKPDFQP